MVNELTTPTKENKRPAEERLIEALTYFISRYTELVAVGYVADITDPSKSDPDWCEGDKKVNLLQTSSILYVDAEGNILNLKHAHGRKSVSLSEYKASNSKQENFQKNTKFESADIHDIVLDIEARSDLALPDKDGFRMQPEVVKQDVARTIIAFLRTALSATGCDTGLLKVGDAVVHGHAYISMDQLAKSFAAQAGHVYNPDDSLIKQSIQGKYSGDNINPIIEKIHKAAEGIHRAQKHLSGVERLSRAGNAVVESVHWMEKPLSYVAAAAVALEATASSPYNPLHLFHIHDTPHFLPLHVIAAGALGVNLLLNPLLHAMNAITKDRYGAGPQFTAFAGEQTFLGRFFSGLGQMFPENIRHLSTSELPGERMRGDVAAMVRDALSRLVKRDGVNK